MRLDQAIKQLSDSEVRKFILDERANVLHIFKNPNPSEDDTHENLTYGLGLELTNVKGGSLMVVNSKFKFLVESTTIHPADDSDISDFSGEVEIF